MQILVVGMHRSGTSMVTRVLNLMGAYFGEESDGTGIVNEENPKGFWERSDVRHVNERMLAAVGADWDRITPWLLRPGPVRGDPKLEKALRQVLMRLDPHRPWVIKDPRLCLVLAQWLVHLERPQLVMPLRDPREVAMSLQRRNGFPLDLGLALWEAYVSEALRSAGERRVHLVHHDALMRDPVAEFGMLAEVLGTEGVQGLRGVDAADLHAFVDPALYRSHAVDLGRHHEEHPAMALYARIRNARIAGATSAGPLSERSMQELKQHEVRHAKVRGSAKVPWQELRRSLEAAAGASPEPFAAEAALARVDDEIAIAGGRAAERLRDLRDQLQQARADTRRAAQAHAVELSRHEAQAQSRDAQVRGLDASLIEMRERESQLRETGIQLNDVLSQERAKLERTQQLLQVEVDCRAALECEHGAFVEAAVRERDELVAAGARERNALSSALGAAESGRDTLREERDRLDGLFVQARDALAAALIREKHLAGNIEAMRADASRNEDTLSSTQARLHGAEQLLGAVRDLQQQADAVTLSMQSLRAAHDAAGRDYRQIRQDLAGLLASLAWRTGHWAARALERILFRKPAWMAHQNLDLVVRRVGGELRSCGAIISTLRRDTNRLADALRAIAASVNHSNGGAVAAPLQVAPRQGEEGIFLAHLARIDNAAMRQSVLERYEGSAAGRPSLTRPDGRRPLVSVIMPAFNRAGLILDAIRSVSEQIYEHWELLVCDDGSEDDTIARVETLGDPRIRVLALPHAGAAAARNSGLEAARGQYIAYLDTDNLWHPEYLARAVSALLDAPGRLSVYSDYVDVTCSGDTYRLRPNRVRPFGYEALSERNFIDLNGFVHDAALVRVLGGFTSTLARQQDWDLVLKMTYLRDPLMIALPLVLYRRNEQWGQITIERKADTEQTARQVGANLASYYAGGLARREWRAHRPRLTVLSWDVCRNHYSKAHNLAEAAVGAFEPRLVGFRFFGEEVFEPYRGESPPFETEVLDGEQFPMFFEALTRAWGRVDGDMIYCVKPRLPSLGLALLANYHTGVPIVLESNDSEAHVGDPQRRDTQAHGDALKLDDCALDDLVNPYSDAWSRVMDGYAREIPLTVTHNHNLDRHYGGTGYYVRNLKDERHYDPDVHDRDAIRRELGYGPGDRVILFGGLLRKHKGIHELVELVRSLGDPRYKLLFAGSRVSPEQQQFERAYADEVRILPPQGRNRMAQINLAADLVVLWLDPAIPASHYQMPYKFTDAIAMRVPVIANDISDLGPLAAQGYLKLVPFGDFAALRCCVTEVFEQPEATTRMTGAARNLYLRQFSYAAANTMLRVLYEHAEVRRGVLPVAERFASDFARFRARVLAGQGAVSEVKQ